MLEREMIEGVKMGGSTQRRCPLEHKRWKDEGFVLMYAYVESSILRGKNTLFAAIRASSAVNGMLRLSPSGRFTDDARDNPFTP